MAASVFAHVLNAATWHKTDLVGVLLYLGSKKRGKAVCNRCIAQSSLLICSSMINVASEERTAAGRFVYAGVLEAMQKHFKAPPQPVLDAWQPAALLDAPDMDETRLLQGPRPTVAEQLLAPPAELQQAVWKHVDAFLLVVG